MSVLERLNKVIEDEGITITKLEREIGASKGVLSRAMKNNTDISTKWISRIVENYPHIDSQWLLTGISTFKPKYKNLTEEPLERYSNPSIPKGATPFFNLVVSAGHSFSDIKGSLTPDGYIKDLPGASSTEALLPVKGYSMAPEIKEGAIIGVRRAGKTDFLNTQHKYLIITHEDRMVKYIEHDLEDNSILWCLSPNYAKFPILKSDIIEVHRVTFVINPE